MPQLNPAPWFAILVFTWLTFSIILPPKVLGHTFPNDPAPQNTQTLKPLSWLWLWH
uniref:ATP synthase complex subunit 8 n=1 Tax=Telmatherina celebensis TaxID=270534 RepID=A0A679EMW6_9TELE|nr:ATPase subunit 8 [Telmatherina celebensis]